MIEIKVYPYRQKDSKNGGYHPTWRLRWEDPVTGKKKSVKSDIPSKDTPRFRAAAREAATKLGQKLQKEHSIGYTNLTWQEFVERFERDHLAGLRPRSREIYRSSLNNFKTLINPASLDRITNKVMRDYQDKLRKHKHHKRGPLTDSSINTYLRQVCSALKWASDNGYITGLEEITRGIKMNRIEKHDVAKGRGLTEDEFKRMLKAVDEEFGQPIRKGSGPNPNRQAILESWKQLLRGLRLSGLRIGEACELDWNDHRRPHIVARDDGRLFIQFPGRYQKNGKTERCPIVPDFAEFLTATPEADRRGKVFQVIGEMGEPITMHALYTSRKIASIGKASGVVVKSRDVKGKQDEYASAHDLRRTFGIKWAKLVTPAELQKLMRHSDITTTMRYYVDIPADEVSDSIYQKYSELGK